MPAQDRRQSRRIKPSAAAVARGMATQEALLNAQFRSQLARRREGRKYLATLSRPPLQGAERKAELESAKDNLGRMREEFRKRRLKAPTAAKQIGRAFTGSFGTTVVPPYDFEWRWAASYGSPSLEIKADPTNGQVWAAADCNWDIRSGAMVRAAVGVLVQPITSGGIMFVLANPAFATAWDTICATSDAHSDGFIGLFIGQYDYRGNFVGAPVNQQIDLWNDDSWFFGAGFHEDSSGGYPLLASFIFNDNYWYAIWVWVGCDMWADGTGSGWSWSLADAALTVTVPSMTWLQV